MPVKVSVVVPVYNTGAYIEACVASVVNQSMSADEYEAIFVDDGSTDDTPERLDRLAEEHSNVRVIHTSNSGWPGRPRNIGVDAAVGEFIQFLDHDDQLGHEALQRMYDYGVENGADIIVGKMAGQGRHVPRELFRTNRPTATVHNSPLIDSLTPHKMFRSSFLNEIGLRFPEGRRRLEDHVFVAEAFLRARNVSVLSDYVCYYHLKRDDAANAGIQTFDPAGYFLNLREALDVVERFTEAGPLRDRLYRRWFRNEMVERLRGRRMIGWPDDYRRQLFDEIRAITIERFGPGVAEGLQPIQQIVAALIIAGELDQLIALARWETSLTASAVLDEIRWTDGALFVAYEAELHADGKPMRYRRDGDVVHLDPPLGATARAAVATQNADTALRIATAKADLVARHRGSAAEFIQPMRADRSVTNDERPRFIVTVRAQVDPLAAAAGAPLAPGIWDLFVRISANGWSYETRLGARRAAGVPTSLVGAVVGEPAWLVWPYWIKGNDNIALDVTRTTKRFAAALDALTPQEATATHRQLVVTLPVYVPAATSMIVRYSEARSERQTETTGVVDTHGVLTADLPPETTDGSRVRIDVGLPPESQDRPPSYLRLGVALDYRTGGAPTVVRRRVARTAPAPRGRRFAPRRVAQGLRRRAGRVKRRMFG
jgi:poly(ribitol-phosphate) beta-N-acetylglucosaminyltransferase